MAVYVTYSPGPTIDAQHSTVADLWDAIFANLPAPHLTAHTWGFAGPPAGLDWWYSGFSASAGAQPYMKATWTNTSAGHTVEIRFRYNPTLLGTLDPSVLFIAESRFPSEWLGAHDASVWASWQSKAGGGSVGANNCAGYVAQLATVFIATLAASVAGGGSTSAGVLYTDGARAGKIAGVVARITYDPSPSEIAAGITQMISERGAYPSDVADGTLNISIGGGVSADTAQSQVPVVQYSGDAAAAAWDGLSDATASIAQITGDWDMVPLLDPARATHLGDMGSPDQLAVEPGAGDIKPIFASAGALVALAAAPELATVALTTIPASALAALVGAAYVAFSVAKSGIIAAGAAAFTWLTDWLPSRITSLVTYSGQLVEKSDGVRLELAKAWDGLHELPVADANLATAVGEALVPSVDTVGEQVTDVATQVGNLQLTVGRSVLLAIEALETPTTSLATSVSTDLVPAVRDSLVPAVEGIETNLDLLTPSLDDLVTAGEATAAAITALRADVETLSTTITALREEVACICLASQDVAKSAYGEPGNPDQPGLAAVIRELRDSLQAVAETRNVLHLRAKGIEVEAESGAVFGD